MIPNQFWIDIWEWVQAGCPDGPFIPRVGLCANVWGWCDARGLDGFGASRLLKKEFEDQGLDGLQPWGYVSGHKYIEGHLTNVYTHQVEEVTLRLEFMRRKYEQAKEV